MSLVGNIVLLAQRVAADVKALKTATTPVTGTLTGTYSYSSTTVTRVGKIVTLNAVVNLPGGGAVGTVLATVVETALRPATHLYPIWSVINGSGVGVGYAIMELTTDGKWNVNALSSPISAGYYVAGVATYPGT